MNVAPKTFAPVGMLFLIAVFVALMALCFVPANMKKSSTASYEGGQAVQSDALNQTPIQSKIENQTEK